MNTIHVYTFDVDFHSEGGALTLPVEAVVSPKTIWNSGEIHQRTHCNGWTVIGSPCEDYYEWVNDFVAIHNTYGAVWGNFEATVRATSEDAYKNFISCFPPEAWDYYDI